MLNVNLLSNYSSANVITVTSPPLGSINLLLEDIAQALVLTVSGEIIAEVTFTYKPNPIISDIFPLQTIQA